jgi:hypothetical protein
MKYSPFETLLDRFTKRPPVAETLMGSIMRAIEGVMAARLGEKLPPYITVTLNPVDYEAVRHHYPFLERQLTAYIVELARQFGASLSDRPGVLLAQDEGTLRGDVQVVADVLDETGRRTDKLDIVQSPTEQPPRDAALLSEGRVVILLDRYVVNIGRQADNHLVLDDGRISRHHCQLRLKNRHYVLYDLNSTHGMFINGVRVTEHTLANGDVIALGGLQLVYVEDDSPDEGRRGDTTHKKPPAF